MALDKADWHYGGDFPEGLPDENGATHIGMFMAWVIQHKLEGEIHHEDAQAEQALDAVRKRTMTGRDFVLTQCDEKFWSVDLNTEGLAFAHHYYADEEGNFGVYFEDYTETLAETLPTLYHVEDNWENFDRLSPVIDQRFREWQQSR